MLPKAISGTLASPTVVRPMPETANIENPATRKLSPRPRNSSGVRRVRHAREIKCTAMAPQAIANRRFPRTTQTVVAAMGVGSEDGRKRLRATRGSRSWSARFLRLG